MTSYSQLFRRGDLCAPGQTLLRPTSLLHSRTRICFLRPTTLQPRNVVVRHSISSATSTVQGNHQHGHHDHHHHSHSHGACCHGHDHFPETSFSRLLDKMGILKIASELEHNTTYTAVGIAAYVTSLVVCIPAISAFLTSSVANLVNTMSLTTTFVLMGFPQLVGSSCIAASGTVDTHVLMTLAALGTLYMGMAQEGALLVLLFSLSHTLEERFTARAEGSLAGLLESLPDKARRVDVSDPVTCAPILSSARSVLARQVAPGELILVRPGEQIPLDGTVAWGSAEVSSQHITGEALPVAVSPGSELAAGSLNTDGLLVLRVTASVEDSTPARIVRMAAEAKANKPRLARWLSNVTQVWSKAVIGFTALSLVAMLAAGVPLLEQGGALYRAMGVLTAGSPCAVVLVPLVYVCAVATTTRKGILLRSSAALDEVLTCGTIALDKTGTLTSGSLSLTAAHVVQLGPPPAPAADKADQGERSAQQQQEQQQVPMQAELHALELSAKDTHHDQHHLTGHTSVHEDQGRRAVAYAVALSRASNHPVSRAMVAYGDNTTNAGNTISGEVHVRDFEQVAGQGVQGVCSIAGAGQGAHSSSDSGAGQQQQPSKVYFGSVDFIVSVLPPGTHRKQMTHLLAHHPELSQARLLSAVLVIESQNGVCDQSPVHVTLLGFEDRLAPGSTAAVAELQEGTWRSSSKVAADVKALVMLTGDNARVASSVASQVGIQSWHASLKPEDKLQLVQQLSGQQQTLQSSTSADNKHNKVNATKAAAGAPAGSGNGVMMVGDGINDAPALAAARVGVAVAGSPSDLVATAADVILLNGQGVANLPWLLAMADKTRQVVRQNLFLSFAAVVAATLPTILGAIPLWLAVLVHEGSTLLVALNSLRLLLGPSTNTSPVAAFMEAGATLKDILTMKHEHHHDHDHHHHDHEHHNHDHHHHHHHHESGQDHEHHHLHDHHHSHTHGAHVGHDHHHDHVHHNAAAVTNGHSHHNSHSHGHDHDHHSHDDHKHGHNGHAAHSHDHHHHHDAHCESCSSGSVSESMNAAVPVSAGGAGRSGSAM